MEKGALAVQESTWKSALAVQKSTWKSALAVQKSTSSWETVQESAREVA